MAPYAAFEFLQNPYASNTPNRATNDSRQYSVIDYSKTQQNLEIALENTDRDSATILDINNILKNFIAYKKTTHKPIKFWTPQL